MRGSCGKLHFLLFCGSRRGASSRYCHNVLPHFAGRGSSMNHTVKIHPYDVNCGWPGALNPHVSQWDFLSHYWQKYAHQIPTYHWLCYSIHFMVFALWVCSRGTTEPYSKNHTKSIMSYICRHTAIVQENKRGTSRQNMTAVPRGPRKQLHISWRKVS